ncbi:hypothetical protein CVT26_006820 [Gymnopilus dilepis]|uniref:DUF6533 domain-containing protein n=1 Tax=Gymnopilus dilepis TaxID=231916 RepID=A0A409VMX5_9AGAR|nr:hypothetical protein CVT26_006820 [Gymnopilus dilepis]
MSEPLTILDTQLVQCTLVACGTLLVYDLLCTLDREVAYVWRPPWSLGTLLFFLNRYLPFIDTFLSLKLKLSMNSPETCQRQFKVVTWMIASGIIISEFILVLRTYAICQRKRYALVTLSISSALAFIPAIIVTDIELRSLKYIPSGYPGCRLSSASSIIIISYILLALSETTMAVLTGIAAYRYLRHSQSRWVTRLYREGLLFYVYLLSVSIANVLVPILAPRIFANWLATAGPPLFPFPLLRLPTAMAATLRRRTLSRILYFGVVALFVKLIFFPSQRSTGPKSNSHQIQGHNFIERATRSDKSLNVQRHPFLQSRMGRDDRDDIFSNLVRNGVRDYWERFQVPYILNKETSSEDAQHVHNAIDQLLSLNGWVGAQCPTLIRPFGQNKREGAYDDLIRADHLYYVAIVIHSADHFLVDQLAVIVQMAKRLGTNNLFVSMLDYDSTDSTETLTDLSEAVLTLLGVPFRIRRVPAMTEDPAAAYYPLEEAHMRNLALEPLHELKERRSIKFSRVVWLKGFTCPNDILETIKISFMNEAAMVCGMDWAEHNGFFIFSDRWRTRDIEGDQFRQSKSNSKPDAVPPRDRQGATRYAQHLPFQVFCCESGTHVVDPGQSYYRGIAYRAGTDFQNLSRAESAPVRDPDAPCLDSSQAWFCRDLWVRSARDAMDEVDKANPGGPMRKREVIEVAARDPLMEGRDAVKVQVGAAEEEVDGDAADRRKQGKDADPDANAGSDYDAMPDEEGAEELPPPDTVALSIPNSVFRPARILVNPRCPTTYAGVSHTQLARDLFGEGDDESITASGKYVLDDWEGAPDSFVCQEQRQTGGRKATKTQRRLGFSIHDEVQKLLE